MPYEIKKMNKKAITFYFLAIGITLIVLYVASYLNKSPYLSGFTIMTALPFFLSFFIGAAIDASVFSYGILYHLSVIIIYALIFIPTLFKSDLGKRKYFTIQITVLLFAIIVNLVLKSTVNAILGI